MSSRDPPVIRKDRRGPLTDGPEFGAARHIFTGGPGESAVRFLGAFKNDAVRYDWTEAQRLGAFEDALVCEPRRWFRFGEFRSWKSLEKSFLLRWAFSGQVADDVIWSDADSVSQDSPRDGAAIAPPPDLLDDDTGSASSSSDGVLTDMFDRVRPRRRFVSRRHRRNVDQSHGLSNIKEFISTLD